MKRHRADLRVAICRIDYKQRCQGELVEKPQTLLREGEWQFGARQTAPIFCNSETSLERLLSIPNLFFEQVAK